MIKRSAGWALFRGRGGPGAATLLAALYRVVLSVGQAINLRNAIQHGQFSISPSASLAVVEFFKLLVSAALFYRVCRQRAAHGIPPSSQSGHAGHIRYFSVSTDDPDLASGAQTGADDALNVSNYEQPLIDRGLEDRPSKPLQLGLPLFWSYVNGESNADAKYDLATLALLQMLANNTHMLSYLVADPGTIQLAKSGVAIAMAIPTVSGLGRKGLFIRWAAMTFQIGGLVLSQFYPHATARTTRYQIHTYDLVVLQAILCTLSSAHGKRKSSKSNIHASNIVLGVFGTTINLFVHFMVRFARPEEPGFFSGYTSSAAVGVVVLGVVVGLADTMAFKSLDMKATWLTTDATTAVLLLVCSTVFTVGLSKFVIPGTAMIFAASLLYLWCAPPKDQNGTVTPSDKAPNVPVRLMVFSKRHKFSILTISTLMGLCAIPVATLAEPAHTPEYRLLMRNDHCSTPPSNLVPPFTDNQASHIVESGEGDLSASPFSNTMAMVRWNEKRTERVPMIMKYQPFFHTIHISMPNQMPDSSVSFHNRTQDQYPHHGTIYMQVANTMKLILEEEPDITGLLYFHFDSWIDPMAWIDENRQSMWYPSAFNSRQPGLDGPRFTCMDDTKFYPGWRWGERLNDTAIAVNGELNRLGKGYKITENEFCVGWSDIYYIPRRFFADYIYLSSVFGCADLFHEVAIPTMLNIIDKSRRGNNPFQSLIDRIGDCWGGCCDDSATPHDVAWTRCGHRLDYRNQKLVDAHYNRLDREAQWLIDSQKKRGGA